MLCLSLCLGCSKERLNRFGKILRFLPKRIFCVRQSLLRLLSLLVVGALVLWHPAVRHSPLSRLLALILIVCLRLLSSLSFGLCIRHRFGGCLIKLVLRSLRLVIRCLLNIFSDLLNRLSGRFIVESSFVPCSTCHVFGSLLDVLSDLLLLLLGSRQLSLRRGQFVTKVGLRLQPLCFLVQLLRYFLSLLSKIVCQFSGWVRSVQRSGGRLVYLLILLLHCFGFGNSLFLNSLRFGHTFVLNLLLSSLLTRDRSFQRRVVWLAGKVSFGGVNSTLSCLLLILGDTHLLFGLAFAQVSLTLFIRHVAFLSFHKCLALFFRSLLCGLSGFFVSMDLLILAGFSLLLRLIQCGGRFGNPFSRFICRLLKIFQWLGLTGCICFRCRLIQFLLGLCQLLLSFRRLSSGCRLICLSNKFVGKLLCFLTELPQFFCQILLLLNELLVRLFVRLLETFIFHSCVLQRCLCLFQRIA